MQSKIKIEKLQCESGSDLCRCFVMDGDAQIKQTRAWLNHFQFGHVTLASIGSSARPHCPCRVVIINNYASFSSPRWKRRERKRIHPRHHSTIDIIFHSSKNNLPRTYRYRYGTCLGLFIRLYYYPVLSNFNGSWLLSSQSWLDPWSQRYRRIGLPDDSRERIRPGSFRDWYV